MGFGTMAVENVTKNQLSCGGRRRPRALLRSERGQSVLEFLLVLPMLLMITMLLVRANTAIQMNIVDQKYAREQTLFVAGNSADYPMRSGITAALSTEWSNQLVIGVSDNHLDENDDSDGGRNTVASTYYIGRKQNMGGSDDPGDTNITQRARVRIRNTVTICMPLISFAGTAAFDFNPSGGGSPKYNLPENPGDYQFCSVKGEGQII